MWKDLYCFALRIDMVLPDWRGFIGLGPHPLVASVPIDLKLAVQPHILKGTCTKPHINHAVLLQLCDLIADLEYSRSPLHGCCVLGERVPKMVR